MIQVVNAAALPPTLSPQSAAIANQSFIKLSCTVPWSLPEAIEDICQTISAGLAGSPLRLERKTHSYGRLSCRKFLG